MARTRFDPTRANGYLDRIREEAFMSSPVDALILDLLEWIGASPRPYADVLDAWRTSCPRLPVWEEANERGLLDHHHDPLRGKTVSVSARGFAHLRSAGRTTSDSIAPRRGGAPPSRART